MKLLWSSSPSPCCRVKGFIEQKGPGIDPILMCLSSFISYLGRSIPNQMSKLAETLNSLNLQSALWDALITLVHIAWLHSRYVLCKKDMYLNLIEKFCICQFSISASLLCKNGNVSQIILWTQAVNIHPYSALVKQTAFMLRQCEIFADHI